MGPVEEGEKPVGFWRQFFSKYSFGIVIYSVLKAIMYAFFTTGGENLLGKQVNDFMGAALPFSCIPCLVSQRSEATLSLPSPTHTHAQRSETRKKKTRQI